MFTLIIVLSVIAAILLILAVLIQDSKGGMGAQFGAGSTQVFGAKRSTDFVEKFTWGAALFFIGLCITATVYSTNNIDEGAVQTNENVEAAQSGAPIAE